MFGARYFGAGYFGARYWGRGGSGEPEPTTTALRFVLPPVTGIDEDDMLLLLAGAIVAAKGVHENRN